MISAFKIGLDDIALKILQYFLGYIARHVVNLNIVKSPQRSTIFLTKYLNIDK